jgi:hypothetical protein
MSFLAAQLMVSDYESVIEMADRGSRPQPKFIFWHGPTEANLSKRPV